MHTYTRTQNNEMSHGGRLTLMNLLCQFFHLPVSVYLCVFFCCTAPFCLSSSLSILIYEAISLEFIFKEAILIISANSEIY